MRSEREVREAVLRDVGNPFGMLSDVEVSLDAYREAVRQAAFAEVAAKVNALRSSCGSAPDGTPCCVSADEVLALLATPPDTGTPPG